MKNHILCILSFVPACASAQVFNCEFAKPVMVQVYDRDSRKGFEGTGAYIGEKAGYHYFLSNAHVASMYMPIEDWKPSKVRKHNNENRYQISTLSGKKSQAKLVDLAYENDLIGLLSEHYLSDGVPLVGYNTDLALFRTRRAYQSDMTRFTIYPDTLEQHYPGIAYSGYPEGKIKNYQGDFYVNKDRGIGVLTGESEIETGASGSPIYQECNYQFHGLLNATLESDEYRKGKVAITDSKGELILVKRETLDLSRFAAFATPHSAIIDMLERNGLELLIGEFTH